MKNRFNVLPIRNKLMFLFMALSGFVLCSAMSIFVVNDGVNFHRDQSSDIDSVARIVARNSEAALAFNDRQAASATLAGLRYHTQVLGAYIFDSEGVPFAHFHQGEGVAGKEEPAAPDASNETLGYFVRMRQGGSRLFTLQNPVALQDVLLEGQRLGTVVVVGDMAPLVDEMQGHLLIILLMLPVAALITFFLARRLQHLVSEPILRLTGIMSRVSSTKDFSIRAGRTSADEIGTLFDGFNEMLCEIEERNETLRQRQERLQELAHFDSLTGLPNRTLFYDRLHQALRNAERFGQNLLVAFIDLDHFKDINDSLGHRMGDLLLVEVAHRLKDVIRSCDTVARLGGDEFTVFAQNIGSDQNSDIIAKHLVETLARPYRVDGRELFITASIGLTSYPKDSCTVDELLRNADLAMYCAKEKGKNAFEHFDPAMNLLASSRLTILNDLHHALERDEFWLAYQPRVDLASGRITGLEALIRWQHPEEGLVMPGKFIQLAEETGLIVGITEWVINTACRQIREWQAAGLPPAPVAVNLPSLLFKRQMAVPMIVAALEQSGVEPRYLEVELTEGTILGGNETTVAQLNELKSLGIIIAIDDFGTGYSSLSYLQRLPIDILKIDKSFIWNISSSDDDLAIVTAIIAMAKSLGLSVVAEGVEKDDQLAFLRTQGCQEIQGYLVSRPVPSNQIDALLAGGALLES
jgi:diguanylate cyclase (GGDEF)-like protein